MPDHLSDALLSVYLDGHLDAARIAALEAHAAECDECRPLWRVTSAMRTPAAPPRPAPRPAPQRAPAMARSLIVTVIGSPAAGKRAPQRTKG